MKPFDLNAALNGAKLVTKEGNPARLICYDRHHSCRFIWLEQDKKGVEYLASGDYEHLDKSLWLADDGPVKHTQTPRPHCELIHAWADGAEIEVFDPEVQGWFHVPTPAWDASSKYRIKPSEPHWYEDLPKQGRLCWVKDSLEEPICPVIDVIVGRSSAATRTYRALSGASWRYATPLTNDEIKQFLTGK